MEWNGRARMQGELVGTAARCRRIAAWAGVLLAAATASAQDAESLNVEWGDGHTWMKLNAAGQEVQYPASVQEAEFPPAGQPPQFVFKREWPAVVLEARWAASTTGWPSDHRLQALDFILMRACDVEAYEDVYPDVVRSSRVVFPPEFVREASNPHKTDLAGTMRGKEVGYEIRAKGGLGVPDYTIRTRIRVGLSEDGKTLFYHDHPEHISKNLKNRETVVVAHDVGDRICFEVRALYVCAPRRLFRDEALRRVESSSRYLVERMYAYLSDAPNSSELKRYYELVRHREQPLEAVVETESEKVDTNPRP